MQTAYRWHFDAESGLWQILSRSGHVMYASDDGDYVRSVCHELCSMFFALGTGRDAVHYRLDSACS